MAEKIVAIDAREILDSRGNPTIEVVVKTSGGAVGIAAVPSGASVGTHEALELRDGDKKRYRGQGVLQAVNNVKGEIAKAIIGMDPMQQKKIDQAMIALDGTENKSRLGANAILGVSLAVCRAAAIAKGEPLYRYIAELHGNDSFRMPIPMMNLVNGGRHANFAIDLQECLILPLMKTFSERVRAGSEVFHALGDILKKKGFTIGVGDEGGYAPKLNANAQAFELLEQAVEAAGYVPGKDIFFGMDVAASEFFDEKKGVYTMQCDGKTLTSSEMMAMYKGWLKKYPIRTIEDPLDEDQWEEWATITEELDTTFVGDDLFVTNKKRLQKGIDMGVANAILIKVNQIGSLSETLDTIALAQKHDYAVAVSHRSGETADTFIADLAVGVGAEYIKTGSLSRSERTEKYNRLMAIEQEL